MGKVWSTWEKQREEFFRGRGWVGGDGEEEAGGGVVWRGGEGRYRKTEGKDQEKIRESRYNRWYREVKGSGVPGLRKGCGESRWSRVARFKLEGEVRSGRYWKGKEERTCRLCGIEEEI